MAFARGAAVPASARRRAGYRPSPRVPCSSRSLLVLMGVEARPARLGPRRAGHMNWVARRMIVASSAVSPSTMPVSAALAHDERCDRTPDQLRQLRRDHDDALPLCGELVDDRVDLELGAHVDAARGLVEDAGSPAPASSHRPNSTFCWLPPERLVMRRLERGRPHAQPAQHRARRPAGAASVVDDPEAVRVARQVREDRVLEAPTASGRRPSSRRSSVSSAMPSRFASMGERIDLRRPPVDADRAGGDRAQAEDAPRPARCAARRRGRRSPGPRPGAAGRRRPGRSRGSGRGQAVDLQQHLARRHVARPG